MNFPERPYSLPKIFSCTARPNIIKDPGFVPIHVVYLSVGTSDHPSFDSKMLIRIDSKKVCALTFLNPSKNLLLTPLFTINFL